MGPVYSAVSTAVAGTLSQGWAWYRERQFVQSYGPVVGPVAAVLTGLTLSQSVQIVGMLKTLSKLFKRKEPLPAPALGKPAQVGVVSKPQWKPSFELLTFALSVISLRIGTVKAREIPLVGWKTPEVRLRRWGLVALLALVLRRLVAQWWSRQGSPIGASWTTPLIQETLRTGPLSSSQQRQVFVDLPIVRSQPQSNHTHGTSASDRNAGTATASLLAHNLGLEPYFVQQSLSDVRKGRDGDRSFHWPKDLAVPPTEFHFDCTSQAAVLIDVDYYIDMPTLMARHPGTYIVMAFQPTAVAKSVGEYTFRFLEDNRVLYQVSGGAEYTHHVWDYAGDTFLVEDVRYLSKTVCAYHIDRKFVDEHHCLILFSLIGCYEMPSVIPTSWTLEGRALTRMRPIADGHVVMDIVQQDGRYRSVAMIGDYTAVTLPRAQYDAVRAVAVAAKQMVSPATVASNIAPASAVGLPTERMPPGHAAILTNYLRSVIPHSPPVVYPPTDCVLPIYFAKHDYDAPVPLAGFGSPLIGPCYAYATSIASDDRCIQGRVEAFQDDDPRVEGPVPPTLAGYMVEFAERLIPIPHVGVPVDHDYVREKQPRPNQRSRLNEAEVTGPFYKRAWSAFVKKETAVKPSDPRNISQGAPMTNLKYSCFMYAFHNVVMSEQEWYAFNKTPAECAQRVCDVLAEALHSVLADGSRFDGHVNRRARIFERICMLRFFSRQYHSDLNEAMDEQIGVPGTTTEGRRYHSGYGRGSGSLETADFNSILTAFIDYCAWRNTLVNGAKCSPDEAWARLGIYGGDDSLAGAVDPKALKKSSELMGQDYEIKVVRRGEIGVEFLNRQFSPDVWNGDVNSMANPSRLLSKLWVGPAKLHQPLQRFAERISGYYRMDRNSPVIGEITRVAHELLGDFVEGELMPWDGKFSLESNWPNEDESGWMIEVFNASIPDFDFDRFQQWICEVRYHEDANMLLRAPLCTASPDSYPPVKQACVVGEELMTPAAKVEGPSDPKGKEEASSGLLADDERPNPDWPLDKNSVWKFTSEELVDRELLDGFKRGGSTAAQTLVNQADAAVPVVGPGGKRVQESAPKQRKKVEPDLKAGKKFTDPREWTIPAKWEQETDAAYANRLKSWQTKRASVAKRLGVKLA